MECAEYAAHAIRRALYVKKDRKPQWPSLRLSGFGLAVTVFPQQNTRITFRLKTPQTRFRSSVLSTGREHWRLAQLCWRGVALDRGTQNEDIFWFVLVFCEHQRLRNHRSTWLFASPKRKYFGPCQPGTLYCELGATVNGVHMLVETFCVCSLQTYLSSMLAMTRFATLRWLGVDWWPHCETKYLLVAYPLIRKDTISQYEIQKVYNL